MDMRSQDDAPVTKSDFKTFQDELRLAFKGVQSGLADVQGRLTNVEDGLTGVQGRLTSVEDGLAGVRGDMAGMQGRLTNVEDGLTGVWAELRATRRNLAVEIVGTRVHAEKQTDILRDEVRARHSETIEHIDGFMTKVGTIDRAQVIADWRMSQLERRVDKIESRPS